MSLGWFSQVVQGERLTWSFGQDEPEHSGALLLRLPERNLSLFVLANSNVLSDPFLTSSVLGSFSMHALRLKGVPKGYAAPQLRAWLESLLQDP